MGDPHLVVLGEAQGGQRRVGVALDHGQPDGEPVRVAGPDPEQVKAKEPGGIACTRDEPHGVLGVLHQVLGALHRVLG